MVNQQIKICVSCNEMLDCSNFHKDKSKRDGFCSYCKKCKNNKDREAYNNNPEKKKKSVKEYMKRTGEYYKYKPYNPKYYSSDISKAKKRARDLKRRVKIRSNDNFEITSNVIQTILNDSNGKCTYCGKDCKGNYHIDHIIPVSRGGGNNRENLCLSCPMCNWSKKDKTAEEYMKYLSETHMQGSNPCQ